MDKKNIMIAATAHVAPFCQILCARSPRRLCTACVVSRQNRHAHYRIQQFLKRAQIALLVHVIKATRAYSIGARTRVDPHPHNSKRFVQKHCVCEHVMQSSKFRLHCSGRTHGITVCSTSGAKVGICASEVTSRKPVTRTCYDPFPFKMIYL